MVILIVIAIGDGDSNSNSDRNTDSNSQGGQPAEWKRRDKLISICIFIYFWHFYGVGSDTPMLKPFTQSTIGEHSS